MYWLLESLFAGGYFVRICSDSLAAVLVAGYMGADAADTSGLFEPGATVTVTGGAWESVLRGVLLLVVTYTVLWPFVVIAMARVGLVNPVSVVLGLQLLAPTAWAGLELSKGVKRYQNKSSSVSSKSS